MSLKKVEQVKRERGFRIWDLLVYGILAVIIAVMFLSVFLTSDKSPLSGIGVFVNNKQVFRYNFDKDDYDILVTDGSVTVEKGADSLKVTVNNDYGKNVIFIEKKGKVSVTEADCGSRNCMYMTPITDNSGIIYCSPHRLRIIPDNYDPNDDIVIIG